MLEFTQLLSAHNHASSVWGYDEIVEMVGCNLSNDPWGSVH
jgi:hypothetical protein